MAGAAGAAEVFYPGFGAEDADECGAAPQRRAAAETEMLQQLTSPRVLMRPEMVQWIADRAAAATGAGGASSSSSSLALAAALGGDGGATALPPLPASGSVAREVSQSSTASQSVGTCPVCMSRPASHRLACHHDLCEPCILRTLSTVNPGAGRFVVPGCPFCRRRIEEPPTKVPRRKRNPEQQQQ